MSQIPKVVNLVSIKSYIKMQLDISRLKNSYFRYILEINMVTCDNMSFFFLEIAVLFDSDNIMYVS